MEGVYCVGYTFAVRIKFVTYRTFSYGTFARIQFNHHRIIVMMIR